MDDPETDRVGRTVAPFTLEDQRRAPVTVSPGDGQRWLLSFHPLAWTLACAAQMQSLEAHLPTFVDLDCVAVGISVDSWISKRAWADEIGVAATPLLADFWPHGEVARAYDVFDERGGMAVRGSFLIDRHGVVRWSVVNDRTTVRALDEYREALAAL